jgi:hypothetical protein
MISLILTSFKRSILNATSLLTYYKKEILYDKPEVFSDPVV